MEHTNNGPQRRPDPQRRPNPRRKRRSRFQRIVRAYFPLAVVLVLVVLFIIFACNSVKRGNEKREQARQESLAVEESLAQVQRELEQKAKDLVKEADKLAAGCNFDEALALLDTFDGNPESFDVLINAKERYSTGESSLVSVEDISTVKCLSFGKLIIDPDTAFSGDRGEDNRYLYITVGEFHRILQGLYDNGYMLVDFYDLFTTTKDAEGKDVIVKNDLRLPSGKKPILLVSTQPNGYESKLVLDDEGFFTSVHQEADGGVTTGPIDFIPHLEAFIEENPGFSYKGARAIVALTGYKGLFGYDLTETGEITKIVQALQDRGYVLAGNTFSDAAYGKLKMQDLEEDIANWNNSVAPIIGQTELLVYARSSDIDDGKEPYSGKLYDALYASGFRYYFGVCYNSTPWMSITKNSVRIGRIMVTGNNLSQMPAFYEGLFDPAQVLEP